MVTANNKLQENRNLVAGMLSMDNKETVTRLYGVKERKAYHWTLRHPLKIVGGVTEISCIL